MNYRLVLTVAIFFSGIALNTFADERDKPFQVDSEVAPTFENSIAQKVQQAMQTLPSAKARFKSGLPKGQSLYLTIRIAGKKGKIEQVFIKVKNWDKSVISGTLANKLRHANGYNLGDEIKFGEGDILDWTLRKADGSYEGNFIGKFVDQWLGGSVSEETVKKM